MMIVNGSVVIVVTAATAAYDDDHADGDHIYSTEFKVNWWATAWRSTYCKYHD